MISSSDPDVLVSSNNKSWSNESCSSHMFLLIEDHNNEIIAQKKISTDSTPSQKETHQNNKPLGPKELSKLDEEAATDGTRVKSIKIE